MLGKQTKLEKRGKKQGENGCSITEKALAEETRGTKEC